MMMVVSSDQLLTRGTAVPAMRTRGPGAGRLSSPDPVFDLAEDPGAVPGAFAPPPPPPAPCAVAPAPRPAVEAPPVAGEPPSAVTAEAGSWLDRAGVPGADSWPPVDEGTTSQYWFIALTVDPEQGLPGGLEAAAGAADHVSKAAAAVRTMSACLTATGTAGVRW